LEKQLMISGNTPKICMVGSSMIDLIARTPRMPALGETIVGSVFQMGYGGKGANQAVMAARLGAHVTAVAKVGRDVFGEGTVKNYRDQSIDATYVLFDESRFSGVAPIWVDEGCGQNTIIIVPGANLGLSPVDVHNARDAILGASVLMCQLEIPIETTLEAFRVAKQDNGKVVTILNPAPAAPIPDELLKLTDLFVPNETETALLTGLPVDTPEKVEAAARALLDRGPKTVIITLGERGALLTERGKDAKHLPAPKVQAVDTTGAGDAFVGSLAYFIASGRGIVDAVERSIGIASQSVLKTGTQISFPTREEVAHLLD
jgi:ribokinase